MQHAEWNKEVEHLEKANFSLLTNNACIVSCVSENGPVPEELKERVKNLLKLKKT